MGAEKAEREIEEEQDSKSKIDCKRKGFLEDSIMYTINQLPRATLITAMEVLAMTAMDAMTDTRYVLESIIVAEERFVAPVIGDAMYEAFLDQKNVLVTEDNLPDLIDAVNVSRLAQRKEALPKGALLPGMLINASELLTEANRRLWDRFLWKITAECVHCIMLPDHWLRTTAQGQQYNNPKSLTAEMLASASGELKDVQFKIDHKLQSVINPLMARMEHWILAHADDYPLFPIKRDSEGNGINKQGKGGMAVGVYE